ncbi:hypothetical protein F511_35222 [Dorcoceras hygrometricum]|uniref:Uncharacterized protein n=1 Tax=Dorcoceras hygrometricum TaxID=472368 RepID=A0A2Z7AXM4_9LAMI|nr:hypothetical protein F511_35222 [Dorcoceras hygrometricum]
MQHAINQYYECMRAIKDRIARLVYQLENQSVEPLYHAQQVIRWKSSVRDLQDPSAHHSSVVFRHDKSSVTTPMIALDFSGTTSQSVSYNVDLNQILTRHGTTIEASQLLPDFENPSSLRSEPCSSSTSLPKLETTRNAHPETRTSRRTNELLCTKTQQLRTSSPTFIQGFKWVAIERATHNESSAT